MSAEAVSPDRNPLTEIVKTRITRPAKVALTIEARRTQRTEAAVLRLALNEYLTRTRKGRAKT